MTRTLLRLPRRDRARHHPGPVAVWIAVFTLVVAVLICLAPGLIAPGDPRETDAAAALEAPSTAHWLGTDQVGRDIATRIVHGARSSFGAGMLATAIAASAGGVLGALSAFGPRWERALALRLTEVGLAIPEFLLALLLLAFLGPGASAVLLAVALAAIPGYARLAALTGRAVLGSEAVQAARILGVSRARLVFRHVLPATLRPVLSLAVLGAATAMLAIAGLSFLGLGVPPSEPDWGVMMSQSRSVVTRGWWTVVFPGLALGATVASLHILHRWLERRETHG